MAKKRSSDHQPYSPVDAALMQSLPTIFHASAPQEAPPVRAAEEPEETPAALTEGRVQEAALSQQMRIPPAESQEEGVLTAQRFAVLPAPTERLTKQLKFQVSQLERVDIMRVVHRFASELETSLDWSHVARALTIILRHAEKEILQHARRSGPLPRPRNDKALALAEFEQQIARILLRAFRETSSLQ